MDVILQFFIKPDLFFKILASLAEKQVGVTHSYGKWNF